MTVLKVLECLGENSRSKKLFHKAEDRLSPPCDLTELVCGCEGSLQAVVLDNRAASLGIAHRPDVGHAQRVAALLTADVLKHKHRTKTSDLNKLNIRATLFLHNYMFVVSLWWVLLTPASRRFWAFQIHEGNVFSR